jgi:hypothetical protein
MRFIRFLISLPAQPIILIYKLYVTYKIVQDTDPFVLSEIETDEQLEKILEPFLNKFITTYRNHLHLFCAVFWCFIIFLLMF